MATFWDGPHHRSPRPETISDSGPRGVGTPSTADRCAGGTHWQLLATFWNGPHHRSPRPETSSDSGPIRVGTPSTADRCDGGTKWQLLTTFWAWFKTGVDRVTARTASLEKGVTNEWLKMAQDGTLWEVFWAISLCPEAIRNGPFWVWAELRSLERKPRICQALCRWIPLVSSQISAQDRGRRIAPLTVPLTGRMCDRRSWIRPS